jgi:hypothetical protein
MEAPRIQQLIGDLLQGSDLSSNKYRVRYQDNQGRVGPGANLTQTRHVFPRGSSAGFMDCNSLVFRAKLNVTSTDTACRLAAPDISCLISRIVLRLGSKIIFDQERHDLIQALSTNLEVTDTERNSFDNYLRDYPTDLSRSSQVTTALASRSVVGKLGVRGTLLNSANLIPLEALKTGLTLDITWNEPSACFLSPANDTALTYVLEEFEFVMTV